MGDTITGVQDDTSGTTGGIEGEDSLDGDVHGRAVEGLEHDLQRVDLAVGPKKEVSRRLLWLELWRFRVSFFCCYSHLGHLLTVSLGVEGSFSQEDGVFLGSHAQLVVEGVVPDLFHVIPVGDDAVLNGVFQSQNTTFGLSLVTDVRVFLAHTHHDTL